MSTCLWIEKEISPWSEQTVTPNWQLILKRALANILLPILPTVLSWSKHPADLNLVSLPVRVLMLSIESYLAVVEFETIRGISNLKPEVYVYKVCDGGIF